MKKYNITVNGTQYEVEVEELGASSNPGSGAANVAAPVSPPVAVAPPAPVQTNQPAAPAAQAPAQNQQAGNSQAVGSVQVNSPMPGTILDVKVAVGQEVKQGDLLCVLEAMKMENDIVSPEDGLVTSVNVSKGASVNSGELLVSLN